MFETNEPPGFQDALNALNERDALLRQQRAFNPSLGSHPILSGDLLAAAAAADIKVTVNPKPIPPGELLPLLLASGSLRRMK